MNNEGLRQPIPVNNPPIEIDIDQPMDNLGSFSHFRHTIIYLPVRPFVAGGKLRVGPSETQHV